MWVTEADVALGSARDSEYRKKMRVHLPEEHEQFRVAARKKDVAYRVDIGGLQFRFECAQDAYIFEHVNVRVCCDLDYFISVVDAGVLFGDGDNFFVWREKIEGIENPAIESITIKQHVDWWLNSSMEDIKTLPDLKEINGII